MKHTYSGAVYYSENGCPGSELNDEYDCTTPDPIFGAPAYALVGQEFSISMTFRTGTTAPLVGFGGPMKVELTINGATKLLNGTGGVSIDGVDPCPYTMPLYGYLCKGWITHDIIVTDGNITGAAYFYTPLWWEFGQSPWFTSDVNAVQSFAFDNDDGMSDFHFYDAKTSRSLRLTLMPDAVVAERLSSIPLPPGFLLLGSGLLGLVACRRRVNLSSA
jgi:hypothetical protein